MKIFKTLAVGMLLVAGSGLSLAAEETTMARWSFNDAYKIADGTGTPTTGSVASTNLHGIKLIPNEKNISGETWLMPWRPTKAGQVASQDDKGAYQENGAIQSDGYALHLTSPVPTPSTPSNTYTYGDATAQFPDGNQYSYQNPYNYYEILAPTTGYKDIKIKIVAAGHNSSTQAYAIAWSTDHTTWNIVGDNYLTGNSYKNWVTSEAALPVADKAQVYIRLFPASTWKGAGNNVNQDNQFNIDDVYLCGTLSAPLCQISGVTVDGQAASTTAEGYDFEYKIAKEFTASTVKVLPAVANGTATMSATDADGDEIDVTRNQDGSYTVPVPASNKAYTLTFVVTPASGAVTQKTHYTMRLFHIGEVSVGTLTVDGKALGASVLSQLNAAPDYKATFTGNTYTAVPVVEAILADGTPAAVTSATQGTNAVYTIKGSGRTFTLTVEGVYLYTPGEKDETVEILYTTSGKTDTGWSNGMYTIVTSSLDGWNNDRFKFNAVENTLTVPAGVVVKTFTLTRFSANYGDGEGLTSLTSEGAVTHVPTAHGFVRGEVYDLLCVLDGHRPGASIDFSIKGGNQPVAGIRLVIEKTNPGTAPVLRNTNVTVNNNHASVVLDFDREMKTAKTTLAGKELTAEGGTTSLAFAAWNLEYEKSYTLTLPAGAVEDMFGNKNTEPIAVDITIGSKLPVAKKAYDYVVSNTDEFTAALKELNNTNKNADAERKVIFMLDGDYNFGKDNEQRFQCYNVSIIGQSRDGVVIRGERNGISNPVLNLRDRSGFYLQDLTLRNDFNYAKADKNTGQAVAVYGGNKTIMKNILMLSNQDTQVTGERAYFDHCEIHGTVDFICGGGDNFYDRCDLVLEDRGGNVIAAPNSSPELKWGYVFSSCTISPVDGAKEVIDGSYHLGRPWQNEPRIYYINTRMNVLPAAAGWTSMGELPTHFYEYGSVDKDGNPIDLSVRQNSPTSTNTYVPVLSKEEADRFTVENVLGGTDGWLPTDYTVLPAAPEVTLGGGNLNWNADPEASTIVVYKDGKYLTNTGDNKHHLTETGVYTLRAANAMGGLGLASAPITVDESGLEVIATSADVKSVEYYNLQGMRVDSTFRGVTIVVTTLTDGTRTVEKKIGK